MKKRRLLCGVAAIGILCGSADAAGIDIEQQQADGPHQVAAQIPVAWPETLWDRSGTVINDKAGRLCIKWLPQHRNDDFLISLRALLEHGVTIDVDAKQYVMSDLDGGNLLRFVRILQGVNSDVEDTNWVRDIVAIDWLLEAYLLGKDEALGELQRYVPAGNENINPHAANILGLLNSTKLKRATGQQIPVDNDQALQYFNAAAGRGLVQAVINRAVLRSAVQLNLQQADYDAIRELFNQADDLEAGYQSWRLFERRAQVEADNKQSQQESLEEILRHGNHPLAAYDYVDLIMHMGDAVIKRKATILRDIATIASERGHKDASKSLADMWQDGLGGRQDIVRAAELRDVAVNQTPLFDARKMNFLRQANEYYYHQHPLDQAIGLELSPWMLSSLREGDRQRINGLWPDLRRQLLYTEADLAPRINKLEVHTIANAYALGKEQTKSLWTVLEKLQNNAICGIMSWDKIDQSFFEMQGILPPTLRIDDRMSGNIALNRRSLNFLKSMGSLGGLQSLTITNPRLPLEQRDPMGVDGAITIAQALQHLPNLKRLELDISNQVIRPNGAIRLFNNIQGLIHLTKLVLIMPNNSIEIDGSRSLADALRDRDNLNVLTLDLKTSYLRGAHVDIINAIRTLNNLMALSIDFSDMDAPQDIMNVFGTMLRDLTNLRALYFNLSSARINRAMFEDFANGLLVQKKLDYLALDFTAGDLGERELTIILDKLVGSREVRVFTDICFRDKGEYLLRYYKRGLLIYIENSNALARALLSVPERKVKKRAEWERKARETILEAGGVYPGNDDLIPEIAYGHEKEYLQFLKGRLVYTPNRDNDEGRREFRIGVLANPLSGTFDIRGCGNSDQYLSISTGFRTDVNRENLGKVEVWILPRFVLQNDPRAKVFNDFLQTLDEYRNKQFVVLFNAGGCELLSRHSVSGIGVSESSGLFDMLREAYDTDGHRLAYDSNNREKLHVHHSCLESFEFLSE